VHDIFRSRVIFLVPVFCWKAEGDVSPGFGAGVAGLGIVLPRGPGSGESAVAHKGPWILPFPLFVVHFGFWTSLTRRVQRKNFGSRLLAFVLWPLTRFGQQAHTELLGLKAING
jgi:hypothetical protein